MQAYKLIIKPTGIEFFTFYATTCAEKCNHQLVVVTTGALILASVSQYMRGSRKFCKRGFNSDNVYFIFIWWVERGSKIALKAGWYWPNIECWLGSFLIYQGIWTSIAKKPYIFVIFQVGSGPPAAPLWIRVCSIGVQMRFLRICDKYQNLICWTMYPSLTITNTLLFTCS